MAKRKLVTAEIVEEGGLVYKKIKKPPSKTKKLSPLKQPLAPCGPIVEVKSPVIVPDASQSNPSRRIVELKENIDRLKFLKEHYESEELKWQRLLRPEAEKITAAQQVEEKKFPLPSQGAGLSDAAYAAHRSLEIQVDGLESMVEGIEALWFRAELMCKELAQDFHRQAFKSLPPLTPRTLIRRLAEQSESEEGT
eukprot:TRINITY_DN1037_c0_g2_i1.p1 TRINITY_DN1037_c0_g2~~TRINITY_DN1037_c0_g2_i1.p1  ORF type:complete len:213 (+),score=37.60 TRINITY_DN1037_c0_g2_i1:56-640(+)